MQGESILADTGALVALVEKADEWHSWAGQTLAELRPPLFTCEAVLTEAWYLLRDNSHAQRALAELHLCEVIKIDFAFEKQATAVYRLLAKYADRPMDLADACVVRMSELRVKVRVWTIDRDFRFYRRNGREPIPLLLPWD